MAVVGLVVVVGGLAACGGDDDGGSLLDSTNDAPPPEDEVSDQAGSQVGGAVETADPAASLTGSWEGSYQCSQGPTGLTLTIDDRGDGQLAANFAYHPLPENPDVATGRYSMVGTSTDAGALSLQGDQWIEQGGDYAMVGVDADSGSRTDPEHLEGTVVGEGCSTFAVDRVSTDPWYVGSWSGKYGCSQGMTGLTLTTEDSGDGNVQATYAFYAVPENPGVPSGSFRMEGTYVDGELGLTGVEWVDRPANYEMVDLRLWSELGIDPLRIYGTVQMTGGGESDCTLFTLDRVED